MKSHLVKIFANSLPFAALAWMLIPTIAFADTTPAPAPTATPTCTPPPGGKCITADELAQVQKALTELANIHTAPAVVTSPDTITVIQDFDGRVYTNGGQTNPIRLKLKLGDTIDRDMAITLPTQVYYRPAPPDPMFRLRIRAQIGLLVPQLVNVFGGGSGNTIQSAFDGGLSWDFFHWNSLNVAAYTGIRSAGGGVGYDLTKNFGPYVGYSLVYDGFRSSILAGAYWSFN